MDLATLPAMGDRVAVITDIHADLPALDAALTRIDALGIERVYCRGDLGDCGCAYIDAHVGRPAATPTHPHALRASGCWSNRTIQIWLSPNTTFSAEPTHALTPVPACASASDAMNSPSRKSRWATT